MSLGGILLKARKKYGHGFRSAYYRDYVRRRILKTRPIVCGSDDRCEIHVLTSSDDWLNLIWALKSFYHYSGRGYGLCIHDDGSLDDSAVDSLRSHFPAARIIKRKNVDPEMERALQPFANCLRFRRTNRLSPKLFDFSHHLKSDRMLLLDSDILFFEEPVELLSRIEDNSYRLNSVNPDISSAYTIEPEAALKEFGIALQPRFNSGLGLIHKESLRLDWMEEFLSRPSVEGHFWRIEQTIFALCSSRFGVELLPEKYAVRLSGGLQGLPSRHYIGAIRHLMYSEGVRHLVQQRFLEQI